MAEIAPGVRAVRAGARLTLVLDRAEKRNALTAEMLAGLAGAAEGAWADGARVLVLTGDGPVFSAGADLAEVRGGTLATSPVWERLSGAVAGFPGLSVAALNGTAAGGALGMVLACDLRVAVPGAELFYPVLKMGVMPQPSDPGRLAALAGPGMAARILLGGARIGSAEAQAAGVLDRVDEDLSGAVDALAAGAEAADPDHLAALVAAVRRARPGPAALQEGPAPRP